MANVTLDINMYQEFIDISKYQSQTDINCSKSYKYTRRLARTLPISITISKRSMNIQVILNIHLDK